jgi:hypothetical protein
MVAKRLSITRRGSGFPNSRWNQEQRMYNTYSLRISNILVPSVHIILEIMKNFARVWIRQGLCLVDILLRNCQESVLQKSKRVFALVPRSATCSETTSSTKFSLVMRRGHGMISCCEQPTLWEISRLTTTVNFWKTYRCLISNWAAVCL